MRMDKAIRDFLIEIEVRKYTPKTIRSYKNNLSLFLHFCEDNDVTDTEDVRLGTVKGFMLLMSERGRKGTYINSLLQTVKSFMFSRIRMEL